MKRFPATCYNAFIDKVFDTVRYHLRVNAEILEICQVEENRIRDAAYAKLQATTVVNEFCCVFSNVFFHLC